jgi:transcriptional regulatory protein RtcR
MQYKKLSVILMKKKVVIGFVGTQLDDGRGSQRWEKWRPTVALTQHEDLVVDRIELLHTGRHQKLLDQLIVDIQAVSPETKVSPVELPIADPWDFEDVYGALFDFAHRYRFDMEHEEYWIHITTGSHVAQICMFLLAEARYFPGVLLQTSPPKRQIGGNFGSYALIDLDLSKYDRIAQRFAHDEADAVNFLKSGIATRNARFNTLIGEIEQVAVRSKAPMLLMGPTGAGKSFLAKRIFELKKARHQLGGAFVEVNCATLRGDGAASALFGHLRGAFTGAANNRAGLLRTANKGLLFLDEIGELGLDEQAMLLKAIEEKKFFPVGGDSEVESDFQLIAGTNRDLGKEVQGGRFREDLYARINLWIYELPSLAQRSEDIEPNLDYLLDQFSAELGRRVRFNKEARQKYMAFASSGDARWSGNFRDLTASVMRMATLADGGRISDQMVDTEVRRLRALWTDKSEDMQSTELQQLLPPEAVEQIDLFDRLQLESVIAICRQSKNLSDAGRRLFAVSRSGRGSTNDADRLRKYLARFGLDWKRLSDI